MSDRQHWTNAVVDNRSPLEPIATDVAPRLSPLKGIRALIFDIYGTLVISGSGDVGTADAGGRSATIAAAIQAVGMETKTMPTVAEFHRQIEQMNEACRTERRPYPEVDIVQVWRQTLRPHVARMSTKRVVQLAAEYESRANPTWPMPGASELLSILKRSNHALGIVSNAQEFTIPIIKDLLSPPSFVAGGFDLDLMVFSNRFRQAKPGPRLFDVLRSGLLRQGIQPDEAIYVGNDMLNDIWAASEAGLKTAWFAGDARSCRRRADVANCAALVPDLVLTELMQLPGCLELQ